MKKLLFYLLAPIFIPLGLFMYIFYPIWEDLGK